MQAFLARIASWLLPKLLDWIMGKASKAYDKYQKKVEKDKEREVTNEKNLKKLQQCKDLKECTLAARDAYNGVRTGPEVSEGN